MRNSSRIYSKIRSLYLLAFLLATAAGIPGLRAEEEGTARLLVERLPEHAESRYHHSDMAPSGDKVAFSVSTEGWDASAIWVYDIPSREMRQLTYPDTSMILGDVLAQWSPNGETIAFASDRGGENSLYLVSSDGGEVRRLTPQPLRDDRNPWACRFSWSPDGERIAFSDGHEEGADLFAIRLNDGAIVTHTQLRRIRGDPLRRSVTCQYIEMSVDHVVTTIDQHAASGAVDTISPVVKFDLVLTRIRVRVFDAEKRPTHRARIDQFAYLPDDGIIELIHHDQQHSLASAGSFDHCVKVCQVGSSWFFTDDMLTRIKRIDNMASVQIMGKYDVNQIDGGIVEQQLVVRRRPCHDGKLCRPGG